MSDNNPTSAVDTAYDNLKTMTARANQVREAIHLLDVCYADLRVMVKYFDDHNADIKEIANPARELMDKLTAKSDNYETWLNSEQVKITAIMRKLGIAE